MIGGLGGENDCENDWRPRMFLSTAAKCSGTESAPLERLHQHVGRTDLIIYYCPREWKRESESSIVFTDFKAIVQKSYFCITGQFSSPSSA